jgi:hypothetical protein
MNFKMTVAALTLMSLSCGAPASVPLRSRGESCVSSSECAGSLVCRSGTCSEPSNGGSGGSGTAMPSPSTGCSPQCLSGSQLCIIHEGSLNCQNICTTDRDCSTCCGTAANGQRVCAPSLSLCPGGGVGGSSLTCSRPSGSGSCTNSSSLWCGDACCSSSFPVSANGRCYTTSAAAASAGATSCVQCVTPSSGGGGGSGAGCRFDGNCLQWVNTLSPNGMPGCRPGESLLPVLQNVCSRSVMCDICLPGRRECEKIVPFDPGQRRGGWAEFGWCTTDRRLEWYCAVDDPQSTKSMITCLRELRGGP